MSKFESNRSMIAFNLIAIMLTMVGVAVLAKGFYIMTAEREYWNAVDSLVKVDSIPVHPLRGNILSSNGHQLACNLPEYKIHMDFQALQESKADTLWHDSLGNDTKTLLSICQGLHEIFPDKSAEEFLAHLKEGYAKRSRCWYIVKGRIDYTTYQRVKKLPIFELRSGVGGFAEEKFMVRNRPYGSLASSIVGGAYKETGIAYSGLELAYDSILCGKPGFKHRRKVLNGWVDMLDSAATDGRDIVTTIDVGMQDLAERSLIRELKEVNGYTGVAIVMEVATGNIKAMVNIDRDPVTGNYYEGANHAISDLLEPGSVFKTASFMVALNDGYIDTTDVINTGNGVREMYKRYMKDHNWTHGGYGTITVSRALQVSSNIGVSALIDKYYHRHPEKFVQGLYNVGIAEDLKLPIAGYQKPRIRMPKKDKTGKHWANWWDTALPWMSIGYETQVPPISVLTFYNAIANNGKMVRPRFIQRIEKDGQVLQEFPVEVLKERICNDNALKKIQGMLYQVVDVGLGKKAGSKLFHVSGKTGTAQKADGHGYKTGTVNYLLSFAGYFPSGLDNNGKPATPKYSCIVCIHKAGLPASGGGMSGKVFHEISEGIMAQNVKYNVKLSRDSTFIGIPDVKDGNILAADYVLSRLGIKTEGGWNGSYAEGNPIWGKAKKQSSNVSVQRAPQYPKTQMPDVTGMGARDAVYLIESRGGKVILKGCGKVRQQSKSPGTPMHKNEKVLLTLS
ncbi:MAG: transpeptidase family protein [Prevotella sp.]|nr:transpeptidase family protein [Candidatus Prevotella equi]